MKKVLKTSRKKSNENHYRYRKKLEERENEIKDLKSKRKEDAVKDTFKYVFYTYKVLK